MPKNSFYLPLFENGVKILLKFKFLGSGLLFSGKNWGKFSEDLAFSLKFTGGFE